MRSFKDNMQFDLHLWVKYGIKTAAVVLGSSGGAARAKENKEGQKTTVN